MARVTDFRVDRVEIADADYWRLPAEVRQLIETYGREVHSVRAGVWVFEIPIYRWEDEIMPLMRRLEAGMAQEGEPSR